jgi:hypothetical protein
VAAADAAWRILCLYRIGQGRVVRELLRLAVVLLPAPLRFERASIAARALAAPEHADQDDNQPALCVTQVAAGNAAAALLEVAVLESRPEAQTADTAAAVALCQTLREAEQCRDAVSTRLCDVLCRLCVRALDGAQTPDADDGSLRVAAGAVTAFAASLLGPDVLPRVSLAAEKVLVRSKTLLAGLDGAAAGLRRATDTLAAAVEHAEAALCDVAATNSGDDSAPTAKRPVADTGRRGKRRLRSRNAYIDRILREEGGDDNYADLEDFIVD